MMTYTLRRPLCFSGAAILAVGWFAASACVAGQTAIDQHVPAAVAHAQDLDMTIQYYSRVQTPEGVLRESRYAEKMLRRPGHVWVTRVMPDSTEPVAADIAHRNNKDSGAVRKLNIVQSVEKEHEHKHFNPVVLARHVIGDGKAVRVEFVDAHEKAVVQIAPSEYENVNFDGSWLNAFYLIDPKAVASLPLSSRAAPVSGASWREHEKNGLFQRLLWDDRKMIPLIVETGDRAGTFFRRIEVKPLSTLSKALPWENLNGYVQKEYSDFLD